MDKAEKMDTVRNISEAEDWFTKNSSGKVVCLANRTRKAVNCYPDAVRFFEDMRIESENADHGEEESNQNQDEWHHRSKQMTCQTCMWFCKKISIRSDVRSNVGRCRRHCPTMNGYPVVLANDWCGDHKLDENK